MKRFFSGLFTTFIALVLVMGLSIPTMALSVISAYAADGGEGPSTRAATDTPYSGPTQGLVQLQDNSSNPDRPTDPATIVFGKAFFDKMACRISTVWPRITLTVLPDAGW